MSISILNNISALVAENSMSTTQANLKSTLTQLSTGLRINSGSDDAAGLSIANGMNANIAALTQSGQNATNATGLLQTADGALSQVTSLLNRAVTLATEASSNGLSSNQSGALNTEYQSIINSINNIGANTNFNGTNVFSNNAVTPFLSDGTSGNNLLGGATFTVGTLSTGGLGLGTSATNTLTATANASNGDSVTIGGTTYTFTTSAPTANGNQVAVGSSTAQTLQNLANAINGGSGAGSAYSANTTANVSAQATLVTGTSITFTASSAGAGTNGNQTGNFISSTTTSGGFTFNNGATFPGGNGTSDLTNVTNAKAALVAITNAINTVSQTRGNLGADINQLTAASNVMTSQTTNLQSAENGIMNADIGKTVANMTQYNVLQATGMSALQQANQAQQSVQKLLQ